MSYWVEIHCDVQSERPGEGPTLRPWCWSDAGDSPGEKAMRLSTAKRWAEKAARGAGWKRSTVPLAEGQSMVVWVCPHCQRFPPLRPNTNGV